MTQFCCSQVRGCYLVKLPEFGPSLLILKRDAGPLFLTNAPFSCMVMLFDAILTGDDPMTLQEFFARHPEAAVAFSGGVDSAWLLHEAARYARRCGAYFVNTPFQPAFELADARAAARQMGVELRVLELDILSAPEVAANPPDRCYHCKKRLFTAIAEAAGQDGYRVLLDGTNASDDAADRPGMRALRELEVWPRPSARAGRPVLSSFSAAAPAAAVSTPAV